MINQLFSSCITLQGFGVPPIMNAWPHLLGLSILEGHGWGVLPHLACFLAHWLQAQQYMTKAAVNTEIQEELKEEAAELSSIVPQSFAPLITSVHKI